MAARSCVHVGAAAVLRGHDDALDGDRLGHARGIAPVAHRDLGLAVGQQVGHRAVAPHRRQAPRHGVREHQRQRHQLRRLVAGEAEHHPLVARADPVERIAAGRAGLERRVDALRDVGRLLVERHVDRAGLGVEAVVRARVADLAHDAARDLRDVQRRGRGDLAGDQHEAGRDAASRMPRGPCGSSVSTASSTASEIWSAILSGWPSVTDSEVNTMSPAIGAAPFVDCARRESMEAGSRSRRRLKAARADCRYPRA